MIRPSIKNYRRNRREDWFTPIDKRENFLGKTALDTRWEHKSPSVNIKKNGMLYEMEIALPGFEKEEINITIDDNILIIRAEKKTESTAQNEYILQEFDSDVLERKFYLANDIGHEEVKANYKNGMLKITFRDVPEEEEAVTKTVAVQ